ncbi:MAG: HAD family hydrolase, partial [Patescibacteria group bacterium]
DGYALGVLSNWAADTLEDILEKLGVKKFFRFIYSSHDLKLDKPDPRIFTAVFRKQRSKYSKIYYVGDDYETDILPARKAGLEAILIDRPSYYPAKIDGVKIKSLEQIEKLLD